MSRNPNLLYISLKNKRLSSKEIGFPRTKWLDLLLHWVGTASFEMLAYFLLFLHLCGIFTHSTNLHIFKTSKAYKEHLLL